MKLTSHIVFTLILGVALTSCIEPSGPEDPGNEFAPQMYHSIPYDGLTQVEEDPNLHNPHGMNMRTPPEGTVPRGKKDYVKRYPNSPEVNMTLKNPFEATEENKKEGQRIYMIYCYPCHGEEGRGDGPVTSKEPGDEKFPRPRPYQLPDVAGQSEGHIYQTIVYGLNAMPSYITQISPDEAWKVTLHVQELQKLENQ